MPNTIAILGAGKLGTTLARLAKERGFDVTIASRKSPSDLQWVLDVLAPGTKVKTATDLIAQADTVLLAIPLSQVMTLDPQAFAGKIVLDATNFWAEVDGTVNHWSSLTQSSAEVVQAHLAQSFVAKAFNHMGYHDLEIEVDRHPETPRAMAFATDHEAIRPAVARLIQALGFAPYDLGALRFGLLLEPGSPLFGAALPTDEFKATLEAIYDSDFGKRIIAARGGVIS